VSSRRELPQELLTALEDAGPQPVLPPRRYVGGAIPSCTVPFFCSRATIQIEPNYVSPRRPPSGIVLTPAAR
jgi:hypothetical protein